MKTVTSFRDLISYQKTRVAAEEVFEVIRRFPRKEQYSLINQVCRSSNAIGAMIAEAWGRRRYQAAFINKLKETQAWLDAALDCGYLNQTFHFRLDALFHEIGTILAGTIERSASFCSRATP